MIRLRPYNKTDAEKIVTWSQDERALRLWSADALCEFGYPLRPEHLNEYYDRQAGNPNLWQMTATDEGNQPVGHFTMRYLGPETNTVHLGFIILDPSQRGQGQGRAMVLQALRYSYDILLADQVTLYVFLDNPAAYRCYESAGFHRDPTGDKSFPIQGHPHPCAQLYHHRP